MHDRTYEPSNCSVGHDTLSSLYYCIHPHPVNCPHAMVSVIACTTCIMKYNNIYYYFLYTLAYTHLASYPGPGKVPPPQKGSGYEANTHHAHTHGEISGAFINFITPCRIYLLTATHLCNLCMYT